MIARVTDVTLYITKQVTKDSSGKHIYENLQDMNTSQGWSFEMGAVPEYVTERIEIRAPKAVSCDKV